MDTIKLYNTNINIKLKNQLINKKKLYNENTIIVLYLKYNDGKKRATVADLTQFSTIGDLTNYFATVGEIGSYKIESED